MRTKQQNIIRMAFVRFSSFFCYFTFSTNLKKNIAITNNEHMSTLQKDHIWTKDGDEYLKNIALNPFQRYLSPSLRSNCDVFLRKKNFF